MKDLRKHLHDYGRYLELEDCIPDWESQLPELRSRIRELQWNRDGKQSDLNALENPGFFQRLLGRVEEKKERLHKQLRESTAAHTAATQELAALEKRIAAGKAELASLSGSREAYERARQAAELTAMEESQLIMEQIAAFTPAALAAADRILDALAEARSWMQQDALRRGVSQENRKLEFLAKAQENVERLCSILQTMPEGIAQVGSYLQSPGSYITCVTSEFKQLDRLNLAMEQVQTVRNQLSNL